ncbi:MAG: hypothetical protein ACI978_000486 [Oleispira sp.]|jgi:hypothetical protein
MKTLLEFRSLLLIALSLFSLQAFATPQELLSNVHKLRLLSTESITNFYMYSGLDADSKYGKKITNNLAAFEKSLATARSLPAADGIADSINQIDRSWNEFNKLIRINYNDMEKQGFPNVRLVDEMGKAHATLLKDLSKAYQDAQISTGTKPAAVVETARTLAVTMEEITSQYAARGTSNLGQVFMGSYERSLDQMAVAFRTDLAKLKQQIDPNDSQNILRAIDSKWNFMERSIKNYNENTVPFLVTSYSERIIMNLEEIVALHDF